jgi:hypothetical protein
MVKLYAIRYKLAILDIVDGFKLFLAAVAASISKHCYYLSLPS